jgi:hypothetical protein
MPCGTLASLRLWGYGIYARMSDTLKTYLSFKVIVIVLGLLIMGVA